MSTIKITGAEVWNSDTRAFEERDVLLRDHLIEEVAPAISASADRVIDASGKHLIPGVIDAQVHFREPGNTYKEDLHTGSIAAAAGGVTTYFEMPNTSPSTTTPDRINSKIVLAESKSITNFAFFVGATGSNVAEINATEHVCGIKVFMGASTGDLLVNEQDQLEEIFRDTDPQRIIALHCEDEARIQKRSAELKAQGRNDAAAHSEARDNESCLIACKRAMDLADRHKHRTHILHVSTREEAEYLATRSEWVTAECAPHHLLNNVDDYAELAGRIKMNPAIKSKADNAGLWAALKNGAIDFIATDHAPHTWEEKTRENIWEVPAGIPAVENSLGLILDVMRRGDISWDQVIAWMCEKPAEVYRLSQKGKIKPGMDADLCLVDLNHQHTIENAKQFTKAKWSPWDGRQFSGWPVMTVVMGQVAFENGAPNVDCLGRNAF